MCSSKTGRLVKLEQHGAHLVSFLDLLVPPFPLPCLPFAVLAIVFCGTQQHRELHHIPIYYASRLASKAIR